MEQIQVKRASLFNRVIAKVIDLTLVFAIFIIFDRFVVHPLVNRVFDYDNLIVQQEQLMIDYGIGEYDEDGYFVYFDGYDASAFESDENVIALTKKINALQLTQWAIDIFVPECIIFFVLPLILKKGRSLGKMLLKIQIINNNGEKAKPLNLFLRFFIGDFILCSIFTILIGLPVCPIISVIMMFVPPKNRSIMDYFGSTIVCSNN